jgi:hypothetical protein
MSQMFATFAGLLELLTIFTQVGVPYHANGEDRINKKLLDNFLTYFYVDALFLL